MQRNASHRRWGEKEGFRLFQKRKNISKGAVAGMGRTCLEKGEPTWMEAPKCMLGGDAQEETESPGGKAQVLGFSLQAREWQMNLISL